MNCQCGGVPVVKHWGSKWKAVCSRRKAPNEKLTDARE